MSVSIRQANPADAPRICDINHSALGYDSDPETVRVQLARILMRDTDRIWVAWDEAAATVVGFVHAADYETLHSGSQKNIIALAVEPAWQGLGLGRMLTDAVEGWARASGCNAVRLVSSFARVKAHAFYLHCGYRLRKEQKNFIKEFETRQG